jgi:hypothetical protein
MDKSPEEENNHRVAEDRRTDEPALNEARGPGLFTRWMDFLLRMGLGDSVLRVSTNILSVLAIAVVIWLTQTYYRQAPADSSVGTTPIASPLSLPVPGPGAPPLPEDSSSVGINRLANITPRSSCLRQKSSFTLQDGDTCSALETVGLQPEILWHRRNAAMIP